MNCYQLINQIYQKFQINIKIQWCKGHRWRGNNYAGHLAKLAIAETVNKMENDLLINKTTPLSINIMKNKLKRSMESSKIQIVDNTGNNQSMLYHIIWTNGWYIKDININIEYRYENIIQIIFTIITQLRTEHIALNLCMHK